MKKQQVGLLHLLLTCWTLGLQQLLVTAVLRRDSSPSAFSASLLYIYATDSIYWQKLTGKLLRDNDTLLILPGVAYKVWCEVLPDGRPSIKSNRPDVISHRPLPLKTMAHVELHRNLFSTLNGIAAGSVDQAKLWCDYTDGARKLRTEVALKPFSAANTTCNYSAVNGLVAEGSMVNFTCTSWSGYPRPVHSCAIVTADNGEAKARAVSVARLSETQVVTTFAVLASRANDNASLECRTSQQVAFEDSGRSLRESLAPGRTQFTFMSESKKGCKMTVTGAKGVTVACQSKGGLPETDHNCWIGVASGPSKAPLPLMAKIEGSTYTTEATLNISWANQNKTVTCVLQQGSHYGKKFSFQIPGFKQSNRSCQFSQQDGGLQARCFSGTGFPTTEHSCSIRLDNRTVEIPAEETQTMDNGTLMSIYLVPLDSAVYRGHQLVCTVGQAGFESSVYLRRIPQFTESRKTCRFISSSWEVRAVCEFSPGYPATHSDCQLLVANSSVSLTLRPVQEQSNASARTSTSYMVRLSGPDFSHAGGTIFCRVFQGSLFSERFEHLIPAYHRPGGGGQLLTERRVQGGRHPIAISGTPTTSTVAEPEPHRISSQTVLTLSLALLAAVLLVLLMSLPVRAARRCLSRSRSKGEGGCVASTEASSVVPLVVAPAGGVVVGGVSPWLLPSGQPQDPTGLSWLLQDSRGYRVNRRVDGMPEIDQYSMFELGGQELQEDPGNKRMSVLASALLRCQAERRRQEFHFSV